MQKLKDSDVRRIYKMIERGFTAKDIAKVLIISDNTVRVYARKFEVYNKKLLANYQFFKKFGFRRCDF